jgi:site-specific recombinase XerD
VLAIGMFLRFLVSVGQAPVDIEERVLGRPAGGRKRTLQPWGLLGPFIESFKHILADNHLARRTVDRHIAAVRRFDHWFSGHGYAIEQLDDAAIEAYRDHLLASRLAADRYTFAIGPVRRLIEHLRCHGVLAPGPIVPKPSEPTLLLQFADWMMRHRGLSRATIDIYARVLRELLAELEEDTSSWEARSLRGFLLSYGSRHGRTGVKHAGTAMRVFLRFLAAQGLCRPGLDGAIPPVASWRLSSLPRYLSASQVERVLATCNVATPTGLRNRAILLLLARMG